MTTPMSPQLVACPFIDPPDKFYVCYKSEVCCKEGCCSIHSYKYFHSWYFWMVLLVLFAVYRYGCLYCKRLEDDQCRRDRAIEMQQRAMLPFRRRLIRQFPDVSSSGSSSAAKRCDPPPDYTAAMALPPMAANNNDEVPSYEQATRK